MSAVENGITMHRFNEGITMNGISNPDGIVGIRSNGLKPGEIGSVEIAYAHGDQVMLGTTIMPKPSTGDKIDFHTAVVEFSPHKGSMNEEQQALIDVVEFAAVKDEKVLEIVKAKK